METKKINYINWWKQTPSDGKEKSAEPYAAQQEPVATPTMPTAPMQQGGTATPYIQPFVVVPYLSADQPMYYYDQGAAAQSSDEVDVKYYEDLFDDEESSALPIEDVTRAKSRERATLKRERVAEKAISDQ